MPKTPNSLLAKLHSPEADQAWPEFVALYTPLLSHWAHRLGLHGADATDFLQDVFLLLLKELPKFSYDPQRRFRGWLWTLFRNRWRQQFRRPTVPVEPLGQHLDQLADADTGREPEEAEYRRFLVTRALELMKERAADANWRICWQLVVEGRPAADVAAEHGLTLNAVYIAKSRALRRLRAELAGLLD